MDFSQKNIEYFEHHDLQLLMEIAVSVSTVAVEPAKRGAWTLKSDGLYVHSKYDPLKEAEKFIGEPGNATLRIHFGFGLGYFLQADMNLPDASYLIYEPNPAFLTAAMGHMPLYQWFAERKIYLTSSLSRFRSLLGELLEPNTTMRLIISPFHRLHYGKELVELSQAISREHNKQGMNRGQFTAQRRLAYWHTFQSLNYWANCHSMVALKDRFKGKIGIIVAPGPSLERNIQELIPFIDQVVIFAPSRSAKLLERMGLAPHFLIHNEPQDFYSFIDGCTNLEQSVFLLAEQCHNSYYKLPQTKLVYQNQSNLAVQWLCEKVPELNRQRVITGGSVATEAFFAAYFAGCQPLVLIGQDLAASGDQYYAGSDANINFSTTTADERKTKAYFGGQVRTFAHYLHFIDWYEDTLAHFKRSQPERVFINATEGGASIQGFEQRSLRETLFRWANPEGNGFNNFRETLPLPPSLTQSMRKEIVTALQDALEPFVLWHKKSPELKQNLVTFSQALRSFPLFKIALDQKSSDLLEALERNPQQTHLESIHLAEALSKGLDRWSQLLSLLQETPAT